MVSLGTPSYTHPPERTLTLTQATISAHLADWALDCTQVLLLHKATRMQNVCKLLKTVGDLKDHLCLEQILFDLPLQIPPGVLENSFILQLFHWKRARSTNILQA